MTAPYDVPEAVSNWFTRAFMLSDSDAPDAAVKRAQMFTPDAAVHTMIGVAVGTKEIVAMFASSGKGILSRSHVLEHIFTRNSGFTEVMVLGRVKMAFDNGQSVDFEFAAHVQLVPDEAGAMKAKLWKFIADSAPIFKAMSAPAAE